MITRQWTVTHRGAEITAVLHLVGSDCTVTVAGGELEHVGAVSVCSKTGEIQTMVLPGHKEQFITEPWCRKLHELTGGAVSVTAGVHYDGLSKQEIADVMDAVQSLLGQAERYFTEFRRMKMKELTREELCGMFDHTNLKAYASRKDLEKLCAEAAEHHFAAVAVNSSVAALCRELLEGTGVRVGATVSFPLGQTTLDTKAFETGKAIDDGAQEIDYVLNVGEVKNGNLEYIRREMAQLTSICHERGVIIKVIFENCYLTKEEIAAVAAIARDVKPDFIKTSTGFGTGGATVEDVRLMKSVVGDEVKVKAAGGIHTWEECRAMIEAGAERIGTSSSFQILAGYDAAQR